MVDAARERFVRTAARLFAERGYARTSVADIQTALGLRGGSGALYKHFASKQDLLGAVVDLHVETMQAGQAQFAAQLPDELEAALRFVADAVWTSLARDRDLLRVLLRDLEPFPALRERMWSHVRSHVYDVFTAWLSSQAARGALRAEDPAATSAVLLASLTYPPILDALLGHLPGDVDAGRYRDAWVRHAVATLRP